MATNKSLTVHELQYHAVTAWMHLSILAEHQDQLPLSDVSKDVIMKAVILMHILCGGEDARENGRKINTETIDN